LKPDRSAAILSLRPGASFALDPSGQLVAWHGPGTAPTFDEVSAELALLIALWEADAWRRARLAEYPSVADLTVAAWEASIEGRPESAAALQAQREAVKAKYPKPVTS